MNVSFFLKRASKTKKRVKTSVCSADYEGDRDFWAGKLAAVNHADILR